MTTTNENREIELVGLVSPSSNLELIFEVYNVDDLLITEIADETSVETRMFRDINYSLEIGIDDTPPVLTNITEISSGSRWVIRRQSKIIQDLNLAGTRLPFESLENALDRLALFAADLKGELDRCYKIPDGELAVAADSKVDILELRKGKFLAWDSNGKLSVVDSIPDQGVVAASVDGISLVESANYSAMLLLLDLIANPTTTTGDIITASSPTVHARIGAPTKGGFALMANQSRGPETAESIEVEPVYRTPWCHPLSEVQGFELGIDSSDPLLTISIGRGVTPPMFETGAAGQLATYSGSENKEIRLIDSLGATGRYRKKISGTWVAGDNSTGGLAEGESIPQVGGGAGSAGGADDVLYVFAMGRSSDDAFDIGFDTNIDGTNLAADTNVIAWAQTGGTQKLFLRRVRTVLIDFNQQLFRQYTCGSTSFFPHYMFFNEDPIDDSDTFGHVPTPGEDTIVELTFDLVPGEDGFGTVEIETMFQLAANKRRIMYETPFSNSPPQTIWDRKISNVVTRVSARANSTFAGNANISVTTTGSGQTKPVMKVFLESWYDPRGYYPNDS